MPKSDNNASYWKKVRRIFAKIIDETFREGAPDPRSVVDHRLEKVVRRLKKLGKEVESIRRLTNAIYAP